LNIVIILQEILVNLISLIYGVSSVFTHSVPVATGAVDGTKALARGKDFAIASSADVFGP